MEKLHRPMTGGGFLLCRQKDDSVSLAAALLLQVELLMGENPMDTLVPSSIRAPGIITSFFSQYEVSNNQNKFDALDVFLVTVLRID